LSTVCWRPKIYGEALSAGHFVNDIYEGSLPALLPFLPLLFQARGYPGAVWGGLLTVFLLSGTLGSLAGGYLSDVIGRRQVIVILLLMSVASILELLRTDGILLWLRTATHH